MIEIRLNYYFVEKRAEETGRQSFHVGHRFLATTTRRRIWKEKNRRRPCSATRSDWDEVIGHVLLRDPNNVLTWKTNDAGLYHYLQHTHTHKQWEILPQKREERIYDVAGSSCHLSVCWGRARVQLSRVLILSTEPMALIIQSDLWKRNQTNQSSWSRSSSNNSLYFSNRLETVNRLQ